LHFFNSIRRGLSDDVNGHSGKETRVSDCACYQSDLLRVNYKRLTRWHRSRSMMRAVRSRCWSLITDNWLCLAGGRRCKWRWMATQPALEILLLECS